jgi:hypothetical protein
MSPDDIDSIVLDLYDLLVKDLGCPLDEDDDYAQLSDFMHEALEKFVTRDRNYN